MVTLKYLEWDGFLLDRKQLIPTSRETWEGVKVVINAVLKRVKPNLVASTSSNTSQRPSTSVSSPFEARQISSLRPFSQQQRPQSNLRVNLHERLNRLRQQQLKARRDFEARASQQKEGENNQRSQMTPQNSNIRVQMNTRLQVQQQTNACVDNSRWCSAWISGTPNICRTSSIYMQKDCRRSCGFCF